MFAVVAGCSLLSILAGVLLFFKKLFYDFMIRDFFVGEGLRRGVRLFFVCRVSWGVCCVTFVLRCCALFHDMLSLTACGNVYDNLKCEAVPAVFFTGTASLLISGLVVAFLFHVYELIVIVIELVLQECKFLRCYNLYSESIFELPSAFHAYESLIDVCCYIRMYVQCEFLLAYFVYKVINFSFELVGEQYA